MSEHKTGDKSHKADRLDAIDLLAADHKHIRKLFKEFEKLGRKTAPAEKAGIAMQICEELTTHAAIEEDLFYPALRSLGDNELLVKEAEVEHASASELIDQIKKMDGSEELYDAKLAVLREHIEHHIDEEEKTLFHQMRKSKLDLHKLGQAIRQRKDESTVELV